MTSSWLTLSLIFRYSAGFLPPSISNSRQEANREQTKLVIVVLSGVIPAGRKGRGGEGGKYIASNPGLPRPDFISPGFEARGGGKERSTCGTESVTFCSLQDVQLLDHRLEGGLLDPRPPELHKNSSEEHLLVERGVPGEWV